MLARELAALLPQLRTCSAHCQPHKLPPPPHRAGRCHCPQLLPPPAPARCFTPHHCSAQSVGTAASWAAAAAAAAGEATSASASLAHGLCCSRYSASHSAAQNGRQSFCLKRPSSSPVPAASCMAKSRGSAQDPTLHACLRGLQVQRGDHSPAAVPAASCAAAQSGQRGGVGAPQPPDTAWCLRELCHIKVSAPEAKAWSHLGPAVAAADCCTFSVHI